LFLVVIASPKETKASNATAGIFEAEFIDINEPYILKKLIKYNVGLWLMANPLYQPKFLENSKICYSGEFCLKNAGSDVTCLRFLG